MKRLSPFLLTLVGVAAITSSSLRAADQPKPPATGEASKSYRNVAVEEFDKMRKGTNVVVLDVRTAKEFSEGHLAITTCVLRPRVVFGAPIERAALDALHEEAHHACFIAQSCKTVVTVEPST